MALIPVESLLQKLGSLMLHEYQLLNGARGEAEDIITELESLRSVLKDADWRREGDTALETWVNQVRRVVHQMEDVLDEFLLKFHMHKDPSFVQLLRKGYESIKQLADRHRLAEELQHLKKTTQCISKRRKLVETGWSSNSGTIAPGVHERVCRTSQFDDPHVVGIDDDIEMLIEQLTKKEPRFMVVSLVGIGGSGKTTLARKVYHDERIKNKFDCYAWVAVSQSPNFHGIFETMVKDLYNSVNDTPPRGIKKMDILNLVEVLNFYLRDKRYVIVLDDVWRSSVLEVISKALPKHGSGEGRIIITSRTSSIAVPLETEIGYAGLVHHVKPLTFEVASALFCKVAFMKLCQGECPKDLENVCYNLVEKCKGLPLAIVALAGAMSMKKTEMEWKVVLDNLRWHLNNNHNLGIVMSILYLSYSELPSHLKSCFLYCCMFPEDHLIRKGKLIRLWAAEGFLEAEAVDGMSREQLGEEYIKELIERSMLQIALRNRAGRVKAYRLHDILREIVISISLKESFGAIVGDRNFKVDRSQRRLALHNSGEQGVLSTFVDGDRRPLRSLFVFGSMENSLCSSFLSKMCKSFILLKVLDLEGAKVNEMPRVLVDLINLRYLCLRKTQVKELPGSFEKLRNLETLDVSQTQIRRLPHGVSELKSLRCLITYSGVGIFGDYGDGCEMPSGICKFNDLTSLAGVCATNENSKSLRHLTTLKKLYIMKVKAEHGYDLCSSIQNMRSLEKLVISSNDCEKEQLQLQALVSPPPFLDYVSLSGPLYWLPHWFSSLRNITMIALRGSRLIGDPFRTLQSLPNLTVLVFAGAYEGSVLTCSSKGFPKLSQLMIHYCRNLKDVVMEEGSFPKLEILGFRECKEMKRVPQGVERLMSLRTLVLRDMAQELLDRLRTDGGEDLKKVQHIAKVYDHDGEKYREMCVQMC